MLPFAIVCVALRYVRDLTRKQLEYRPGGQYLRGLEVRHHIEEVVTEEDPSLCQEDSETDRIPDNAGLTLRQLTLIVRIS